MTDDPKDPCNKCEAPCPCQIVSERYEFEGRWWVIERYEIPKENNVIMERRGEEPGKYRIWRTVQDFQCATFPILRPVEAIEEKTVYLIDPSNGAPQVYMYGINMVAPEFETVPEPGTPVEESDYPESCHTTPPVASVGEGKMVIIQSRIMGRTNEFERLHQDMRWEWNGTNWQLICPAPPSAPPPVAPERYELGGVTYEKTGEKRPPLKGETYLSYGKVLWAEVDMQISQFILRPVAPVGDNPIPKCEICGSPAIYESKYCTKCGQSVARNHCSQCGKSFTERACGLTHALIAAQMAKPIPGTKNGVELPPPEHEEVIKGTVSLITDYGEEKTSRLMEEKTILQSLLAQTEMDLGRFQHWLNDAKQRLAALTAERDALIVDKGHWRKPCDDLDEQHKTLRAENERLKAKLAELGVTDV